MLQLVEIVFASANGVDYRSDALRGNTGPILDGIGFDSRIGSAGIEENPPFS
jgi:hypothetical protein